MVDYVVFQVTMDSVKPFSTMLKAIKEFPDPTNLTQMRSFFGLVDKVSRVQKTLNSSYKPDPEFLNLPSLSRTQRQNEVTKLSYFAKLKTE